MIAFADDEQYLYTVQAMIDLDFNDSLDESRLTRTHGMNPDSIWEVAPSWGASAWDGWDA